MPTCRSETCCPPVSSYKADADARATVPDGECPVARVTITPEDGSYVIMPTFVALSCNVAGAVIYYTTDGTDPTEESTVYSAPFEVDSHYTTVKARAKLAGCDLGPVSSATYPVLEGSSWAFAYLCETGDHVGAFDEFAANGQANDYQFVLVFTLDADTEILDITILQTDATGFWNSGQSWSTKEYINPYIDPTIPFHTYPLVIIDEVGPTQLFTSYQTTLGVITADTYEWRLWGQPFTTLNGFFLARITLGDGTVIKRMIEATCTPPPPPCETPTALTLAATCFPSISYAGSPTEICRIWRRSVCDEVGLGEWVILEERGAGAFSTDDVEVQYCCAYDYYIEEFCGDAWVASAVSSVTVPCECALTLSEPDTICLGESATITFEGAHCVGEISWGTGGEGGGFTGTGALSGEIEVSPVVTTTYTFKGTSDSCGDFFESVTITVEECPPPETCVKDDYASTYQFTGDPEEIFDDFNVDCTGLGIGTVAATGNGAMTEVEDLYTCSWAGTFQQPGNPGNGFNVGVSLVAGGWRLTITGQISGDAAIVWTGLKTYGSTPSGGYTRTSGCLMTGSFNVS